MIQKGMGSVLGMLPSGLHLKYRGKLGNKMDFERICEHNSKIDVAHFNFNLVLF